MKGKVDLKVAKNSHLATMIHARFNVCAMQKDIGVPIAILLFGGWKENII
jgi:hypothetical protein